MEKRPAPRARLGAGERSTSNQPGPRAEVSGISPLAQTPKGERIDLGHYLFCPAGSLVRGVLGGTVLFASGLRGLGQVVIIEHESGVSTVYAFLGEIGVVKGQQIQSGEYIGTAGVVKNLGRSGLRFEVRKGEDMTTLRDLPGVDAQNLNALLLGTARRRR